jgi:hypothetical protein
MRFHGHFYVRVYDRNEEEICSKQCACANKNLARQVARDRVKESGVYFAQVEDASGNPVYTVTAKGGAR